MINETSWYSLGQIYREENQNVIEQQETIILENLIREAQLKGLHALICLKDLRVVDIHSSYRSADNCFAITSSCMLSKMVNRCCRQAGRQRLLTTFFADTDDDTTTKYWIQRKIQEECSGVLPVISTEHKKQYDWVRSIFFQETLRMTSSMITGFSFKISME